MVLSVKSLPFSFPAYYGWSCGVALCLFFFHSAHRFSRLWFCPHRFAIRYYMLKETGGLFRLAVALMQAFSDDRRNYTPLLDQLALYFQIRDDLINLSSLEYMKGKSFCEDLTVGCDSCRQVLRVDRRAFVVLSGCTWPAVQVKGWQFSGRNVPGFDNSLLPGGSVCSPAVDGPNLSLLCAS